MVFADDLVICEESRLEVEQQLDRWREVLEENGMIISRKRRNTWDQQDLVKKFAQQEYQYHAPTH